MTAGPEQRPTPVGYLHDALFFDSDEDLLDATLGFAAGALATGERLALACSEERNALIAGALDGLEDVTALPRASVYLSPPAALDYYRQLAQRAAAQGAPGLRILGEVPTGADAVRQREWARFEAVCNLALADLPVWSICAYDSRATPALVAHGALATHPMLRRDGRREQNPDYIEPTTYLAATALPPPLPVEAAPAALTLTGLEHDAVRVARERVRLALADHVRTAPGVPGSAWSRIDDVVLAVHEVTDNAVRHGKPPVTVRMWVDAADVVCTVTDAGPGLEDPFGGYVRQGAAMGLWVARRLCDELDARHDDEGFTVRLRLTLGG